jgi:hypothetical protein
MFCGWRLTNCVPELVDLGSGTLRIDAVSAGCLFDDEAIPKLSIAEELQAWLHEDLARNRIPLEALLAATLVAKLSFSEIRRGERITGDHFFDDAGRTVRTPTMHRCAIHCRSEVATEGAVYRSELRDIEEWPIGWPAA